MQYGHIGFTYKDIRERIISYEEIVRKYKGNMVWILAYYWVLGEEERNPVDFERSSGIRQNQRQVEQRYPTKRVISSEKAPRLSPMVIEDVDIIEDEIAFVFHVNGSRRYIRNTFVYDLESQVVLFNPLKRYHKEIYAGQVLSDFTTEEIILAWGPPYYKEVYEDYEEWFFSDKKSIKINGKKVYNSKINVR